MSEFVSVEGSVPGEHHGVRQKPQKLFGCRLFRALTGEEEEIYDVPPFINGRGEP